LAYGFYSAPLKPKVLPKPPKAIIASMIMKKKLLSIPQDGPAANSMNRRSRSRKPLLLHLQAVAMGATAVPGLQ